MHGFAGIGRVPVFELKVSEGLWLTNKIALLQLEHFNKSNALGWALTMGLFAMPVIYSEREFNQITGESYYIQLGPDDRFGWTEPAGNVFQIAADNLTRLKNEIYRVSLPDAAGGRRVRRAAIGAEPAMGLQRDAGDPAGLWGHRERLDSERAERHRGGAAGRSCRSTRRGWTNSTSRDFSTEVNDARSLLDLGIQSPTLTKQVQKRVAMKYLCDARQEIKNRIAEEIDASKR